MKAIFGSNCPWNKKVAKIVKWLVFMQPFLWRTLLALFLECFGRITPLPPTSPPRYTLCCFIQKRRMELPYHMYSAKNRKQQSLQGSWNIINCYVNESHWSHFSLIFRGCLVKIWVYILQRVRLVWNKAFFFSLFCLTSDIIISLITAGVDTCRHGGIWSNEIPNCSLKPLLSSRLTQKVPKTHWAP